MIIILSNLIIHIKKGLAMTKKLELYKCDVCGNLIEVIIEAQGELVCCGEKMRLLETHNSKDELGEKHLPEIVLNENGEKEVRLVQHPMTNEHYIMFLETISKDKNSVQLKYFYPNQEVKLTLCKDENSTPRSYCNIHELWGEHL